NLLNTLLASFLQIRQQLMVSKSILKVGKLGLIALHECVVHAIYIYRRASQLLWQSLHRLDWNLLHLARVQVADPDGHVAGVDGDEGLARDFDFGLGAKDAPSERLVGGTSRAERRGEDAAAGEAA